MPLSLRALFTLLTIVAIAAAAAWLASSSETVTLQWGGWRIDTSLGVLVAMGAALFLLGALILWILRATGAVPARLRRRRDRRRREEGYLALTRGMVAIAAGDPADARRYASRANALLENPAGALLIAAQAAQMEGDEETARRFYAAMRDAPETELLGLRGLVTLSEQTGDVGAALSYTEEAHRLSPKTPWVLTKRFHLHLAARRWEDAEVALRAAMKARAVEDRTGRHEDAVLLVQLSLMAERTGDRRLAIERARRAISLDPHLLPAALQLAALLHAEGRNRQAGRVIEDAWKFAPHPDLARLYGLVAGDGGALGRLRAVEQLAETHGEHRDTRVSLAQAALEAELWGEARRHLEGVGDAPDAALCRLHAEIEEREGGDPSAARAWLARVSDAPPAPAWLCGTCGAAARDWSALCGHCGAFDGFTWTTPPRVQRLDDGDADDRAPVVEAETEPAKAPRALPSPEANNAA